MLPFWMNADKATSQTTITTLIERANVGDRDALNSLIAAMYPELHALARSRLRKNAPLTLLDTTALLHEAYLRLVNLGTLNVENRAHFLAYAARTMRSIVVDFARRRLAERRGGNVPDEVIDTEFGVSDQAGEQEIVRVHDALLELEQMDERLVRVVEMRYFGGLTEEEIAAALGVTYRTVRRDWEKARMVLALALK